MSLMFLVFCRYGRLNVPIEPSIRHFLLQAFKHQDKHCTVCSKEEEKYSQAGLPDPGFNYGQLIQRQILPANYCWICEEQFQDSQAQILHFANIHECDICGLYFEKESEKENHRCIKLLAF